jgi:hypothetical protein
VKRAKDLDGRLETIYRLRGGVIGPVPEIEDRDYPICFDRPFFSRLRKLENSGVRNDIIKKYSRTKFVVLLQRGPVAVASHNGGLLDNLVINAAFAATLKKIHHFFNHAGEIKHAGGIAIFIVDPGEAGIAVAFSQAARLALADEKIPCTIGIDSGEVLIFPLEDGTTEIAGSPVNICSKLATDYGKPGKIYISENAAQKITLPKCKSLSAKISHVVIRGFVL